MAFALTETMIRSGASREIVQRGREYYREGAIRDAAISGNTLTAKCAGTAEPYYRVRAVLDDSGVVDASCTCPYEYGGYCKHIVALLLAYMNDADSFEQRADPRDLLQAMDRDQLLALLDKLMQKHAEVADDVQHWATSPVGTPARVAGKSKRAKAGSPVDLDAYRQRIRSLIRGAVDAYDDYREESDPVLEEKLDEIRQAIVDLIEADQPKHALAVALAVLGEIDKSQDYMDYELIEFDDFTHDLDLPIAEAVLSVDLSASEKQRLQKRLGDSEYRYRSARAALEQGWDATGNPPVAASRKAVDEVTESEEDEDYDEEGDDEGDIVEYEADAAGNYTAVMPDQVFGPAPDIVDAQLNVLHRRGEHERFLSIALAAGRHLRYAQELAELDRVPEAVQHAAKTLKTADDALALAQLLHGRGLIDDAMAVAGHGLSLAQPRIELGRWLAPIAASRHDDGLTRRAWVAVFGEEPSLPLYQKIQKLAGPQWTKVRRELHKLLKGSWHREEFAEILLYEQDWDAAIKLAGTGGRDMYNSVQEIVADGVVQHRPDWVVEVSKRRAEALIATVSSSHYPAAAEWLSRVKKAYKVLGQTKTWDVYLAQLKETYRRRPALQAQLERL